MFCVFLPEDASLGRARNFEIWRKTVPPVTEFATSKRVSIAIDGWPGGSPEYPALGCPPEMWRVMFANCPNGLGLNYDPSHLVRISIDHLRALNEFAHKVLYIHAKDTVFDQEACYCTGILALFPITRVVLVRIGGTPLSWETGL